MKRLCCLVNPFARCVYCYLVVCHLCDGRRSSHSLVLPICENNKMGTKTHFNVDKHLLLSHLTKPDDVKKLHGRL